MTPEGRGVVGVKADQRGCGARGQDRAHKSSPLSEEAIFFHFAIRIKIQSQSSDCAPASVQRFLFKASRQSWEGGLGGSGLLGGGSTGSCIFGSMRTSAQGGVGNCPTDLYIKLFN